jgi:hypothetical protein
VVGTEIRELSLKDPWVKTFGTIDGELELMNAAWPAMQQVFFSVRREEMPALERPHEDQGTPPPLLLEARHPLNLLTRNSVGLLTVDKGCIAQPPHGHESNRWEDLLNHTPWGLRPKVVIEIWSSNAQTWEKGPAGKVCRERWRERGHVSRFRRVDATQVGGAIQQVRFIAVRAKEGWASCWQWPVFEKDAFQVRSMSSLLTFPGLVSARDCGSPAGTLRPGRTRRPLGSRRREVPGVCTSTKQLGAWGCRRNGSGALRLSITASFPRPLLFIWEHLSETLSSELPNEPPPPPRPHRPVPTHSDFPHPSAPPAVPPFSWIPPNLAPGGAWHDKRMEHLARCGLLP